MADYYDLLVGLHPDGALRQLGEAALVRPAVIIPCAISGMSSGAGNTRYWRRLRTSTGNVRSDLNESNSVSRDQKTSLSYPNLFNTRHTDLSRL